MIYVAGPYSKGNIEENIYRAIETADNLRELGHTPYIPHLTHFWEMVIHHDYEYWMNLDLEWLAICDGVLRLSGDSDGADNEVKFAKSLKIPVYTDISEIKRTSYYEFYQKDGDY